ncbi:MAG: hypothetical protein PVJ57_01570 [Phycisphaerae bacterium]|jgi:hypothetical protein
MFKAWVAKTWGWKRALSVAVVLVVSCSLSGCGGGSLLEDGAGVLGELGEGGAWLRADPATLVFGEYLTERSFELTNLSGHAVTYTVSSGADWVQASAPQGDIGDETQEVRVVVDRGALSSGDYSATLEIQAEGQTTLVTVQANVPDTGDAEEGGTSGGTGGGGPSPLGPTDDDTGGDTEGGLSVTPETLALGSAATTAQIYVRNLGTGELAYEVQADVGWITLDNASGTSNGEYRAVGVHVSRDGLPTGYYQGTLVVNAGGERAYVAVTMAVGEADSQPVLWVSESQVDFGHATEAGSFVVRNTGLGTLDFSVSCDEKWVRVSPESGSNTGENDVINVTVSRAELTPGNYSGLVEVASEDGQWAGVVVRMTVDPPPAALQVNVDTLDYGEDDIERLVELYNSSDQTLSFVVTPDDDWVEPDVRSGSLGPKAWRTVSVVVRRCETSWQTGLNESTLVITGGGEEYVLPVLVERAPPPSDAEIVAALQLLPPLPKVHHNFGFYDYMLDDPNDPVLYEYVRVTHSAGLLVRWVDAPEARAAVYACKQVNATNPTLPATIALHFSPYAHWWPRGAPPTYTGPEYQEELDNFTYYLSGVKDMIDAANTEFGSNVQVSGIFLDTEIWKIQEQGGSGADTWNAAMVEKYDAMYDICKSVYPSAPVNWFARGRGCCNRYFNLEEQGDSFSGGFYSQDMEAMRAYFLQIYDQAQLYGNVPIQPWFSLGEGTVRLDGDRYFYLCDKDYELSVSWQIGAELNDPWYGQSPDYPPWDYVDELVIFPGPRPRAPDFFRHFVAYVRGAHNMPLNPQ